LGLPLCRRDRACLHEALEAAEILSDRLLGGFVEDAREPLAEDAARRDVVDDDAHLRPPAAGSRDEPYAAAVVDLGAFDAAPGDQLIGDVIDDLGIPLDVDVARAGDDPAGTLVVDLPNFLHMARERRHVLELPPEAV